MPRVAPPLTAARVEKLLREGKPLKVADGACTGLTLKVTDKSAGSWVLRYVAEDGRRRDMGLGSAAAPGTMAGVSLSEARELAEAHRKTLRSGGEGRTHDGRKFRMLNVIDEFTRECLVIRIDRKLKSTDVIDVLTDLFILRGAPGHIRSDNGPEFIAKAVRQWIAAVGAEAAFIEPGSPWENGYCESFNSKLRDELLNGEIFYSLAEARVVIESWRQHYNTARPHSSLGYKPPAPNALLWPAIQAKPAAAVTPDVADKPTMH